MNGEVQQPFSLVMIEDDEGHAHLIEKNLHRGGINNPIVHLRDGAEAVKFFFNPDQSHVLPERLMILLDLNLPNIDGYEFLKRLKSDPKTRMIPVIVLTTTDNPVEIERCYELGCNLYMNKPIEYENFSAAIRELAIMMAIIKIPMSRK